MQQLLDWTVRAILARLQRELSRLSGATEHREPEVHAERVEFIRDKLHQGGNYEAMKKGMLLCFAQAQRAAVITEAKVVDGALAYRIQVPILQTCQNSQQQSTQNLRDDGARLEDECRGSCRWSCDRAARRDCSVRGGFACREDR